MKRSALSGALLSIFVASCGRGSSSSTSPAIEINELVGPPPGATLLADCLRALHDSICFSGLQLAGRAGAAAALAPERPLMWRRPSPAAR